ncbi:DUF2977 domain-containing protein [Lactiplantibacillus plantarum]|uniref:DUF2977 domain-containing protein n=1 Tax=Lactiplantibacillus plantarum TaxID=1590 RepID=UPI000B40D3E3|nr:DUF2977 domain-containing protein [Lactiplantibacillus plantarum]
MQFDINENKEILAYAILGGLTDGVEVHDPVLPDDFEENFKPSFYLLQNGTVVANQNYVASVEPTPDIRPTAEQESMTAIAQQMADQQQHIASLEQALTALAEGGAKS